MRRQGHSTPLGYRRQGLADWYWTKVPGTHQTTDKSQNWIQARGRCGVAGIAAFPTAHAAEPGLTLQQPDLCGNGA
ncbi:hypothetical protein LX32DRAFT_125753 [Colletotrichum zoysiae]|uniref:Uncharacterized protein n=1 Tax=Colletotrichum zoysiae TaxID=1216348 RepID=A0AAD9H9G6_9PEZI|nr:hypothetical protein LX32DRAFT_125753 [Colletotrichum zoysiae]